MSRRKVIAIAATLGLVAWGAAVVPSHVVDDMLCLDLNGGSLTASDGTPVGDGRYIVTGREGPSLVWRMLTFWTKEGRYRLVPISAAGTRSGAGFEVAMLPVDRNSTKLYRAHHECPPKGG